MRHGGWLTIGIMAMLAGCPGGNPAQGGPDGGSEEGAHEPAQASEVALERITTDRADILFVIDNSGSMREEQVALRAQFPRMLESLSSGDVDGDGEEDFPPFQSLRLGVTSTDMGLIGISGIPNCDGFGDDGLLQTAGDTSIPGCNPSYPEFLGYERGQDTVHQVATDFACVASLGTEGCGFEQQLEATLKAVWPASDDRITFLGDPITREGTEGHGDRGNAHLFETDPDDPSLLIVVLVTDEEDCSSNDLTHFTPPQFLEPTDPLAMQDLNLRCFFNPNNLYPTGRYVEALRNLRPGHPERVMFSVIAGVPPELVNAEARAEVDFEDADSRNAFYDAMLADARMQEVPDPTRTPEQGGNLTPSCMTDNDGDGVVDSRAFPPRRLVAVARDFGSNGFVQSICQGDFAPAMDAIMNRVAARMAD